MRTAECQDGVTSADGPYHARLFDTRADYCLASSFDHTRANKQMLAAKLGIAHTLCISFEVICLGAKSSRPFGDWQCRWPAARPRVFRFSLYPAGASGGPSSKFSV